MQWTLRHAYDNVPHYRAAFDAAGVHPDDLKTLADLAKFPFTGKKDLRDNYPFGLFAVPQERTSEVQLPSSRWKPAGQAVAATADPAPPKETVRARRMPTY